MDALVALQVAFHQLDVVHHPEQVLAPPGGEVVEHAHVVAVAQQAVNHVRADEPPAPVTRIFTACKLTHPLLDAPRTLRGTPPTEPDITIVVPAWGPYAGPPLAEAVDSLRDQDLPARIVVVDNASEERLPELEGVEVIRTPRRLTLGAARNFGLARVTTPYVIFWDADDLMPAGTLRFLRERLSQRPRPRRSRRRHRRGRAADSAPMAAAIRCPARASAAPVRAVPLGLVALPNDRRNADPGRGGQGGRRVRRRRQRRRLGARSFADASRPRRTARATGTHLPPPGALDLGAASRLRHLFARARAVRRRLRTDPAASRSTRALVPAVAVLQVAVLIVGRPVGRALRRLAR